MKVTVAAPQPNEFIIYVPGPQGPKGDIGSYWISGAGVPASGTGRIFDYYLNSTTGDFYEKTTATVWTLRGNIKGVKGDTGTINLGTVATGIAGSSVVITNTGTATNGIFNFTIPRGDKGNTGTSSVGTTTTSAPGTNAAVSNTGTPEAGIFNFTIPRGDKGATGTLSLGTVATGAAGSSVVISNTGTPEAGIFNFTIPRGDKGNTGTLALGTVTTGAAGSSAVITNTGTPEAGIFNFTIPKGDKGTAWLSGTVVPASGTGVVGDWYLNTATDDIYEKTTTTVWTLRDNIKGNTGTIAVGTVTASAPGSAPVITNAGTSTSAVFNFTLPRGDTGPMGPTGSTVEQTFTSDDAAGIPLQAKAFTGQTGDLQRWLDSAGNPLAKIASTGEFVAPLTTTHLKPSYATANTGASFGGYWARIGTVTIPSQYEDSYARFVIQQAGDGNATQTFATVNFRVKQQAAFGADPLVDLVVLDNRNINPTDFVAVITSNTTPSTVELWMRAPSTYQAFCFFTMQSGRFFTPNGNAAWQAALPAGTQVAAIPSPSAMFGTVIASGGYVLGVRPRLTTDVGIRVQGLPSQTGNLQEWTNQSATVVANVDATGNIFTSVSLGIGTAPFTGSARLAVFNNATNQVGAAIRGFAGQTASLQQWQTSAGTAVSQITNLGGFRSDVVGLGISTGGTTTVELDSPSVAGAFAWAPVNSTLSIKGIDGPRLRLYANTTAHGSNLTEWYGVNSALAARVYASGSFATNGRIVSGDVNATIASQLAITNNQAVTTPTAIFRSMAGQTANIAEFQDSAGNILARIGNDGTIYKGASSAAYGAGLSTTDTEILGFMGAF